MSHSFTKLFSTITDSSIWSEDSDTKVVWVTMLAMANANGKVFASILGIAKRANVSLEKTEEALKKFQLPDKYSRSKDFEGRRIELIDGGWQLLNYVKYRKVRQEDERREYQRNYWHKRKTQQKLNNTQQTQPNSTHAEAEAEAEAEEDKDKEKEQQSPAGFESIKLSNHPKTPIPINPLTHPKPVRSKSSYEDTALGRRWKLDFKASTGHEYQWGGRRDDLAAQKIYDRPEGWEVILTWAVGGRKSDNKFLRSVAKTLHGFCEQLVHFIPEEDGVKSKPISSKDFLKSIGLRL
jgi:hypothetical protein